MGAQGRVGRAPERGSGSTQGLGPELGGRKACPRKALPGPLPTRNGPLQAASLGLGGLAEPHGLGGAQQGWAESRPGSLMVTRPRSTARGCREGPRQEDRCTWTRPAPPRPHLPHQAALGR